MEQFIDGFPLPSQSPRLVVVGILIERVGKVDSELLVMRSHFFAAGDIGIAPPEGLVIVGAKGGGIVDFLNEFGVFFCETACLRKESPDHGERIV